jgi:hypothetical protein
VNTSLILARTTTEVSLTAAAAGQLGRYVSLVVTVMVRDMLVALLLLKTAVTVVLPAVKGTRRLPSSG